MRVLRYVTVVIVTVAAALAVPVAAQAAPSWYSGIVAAGATQNWTWNNADPHNVAYEVGFNPVGATSAAPCQFEAIRSWYVQQPQGEREFKFTIKNVGTIACGTTIMLRELPTIAGTWLTPWLVPGATSSHTWNNASDLGAYVAGLSPIGATSSTPCQLEVTRKLDVYRVNWDGGDGHMEREFRITVANVGAVTCYGHILIGSVGDLNAYEADELSPNEAKTFAWNNANPTNKVYVVGVSAHILPIQCEFEVTRQWYLTRINAGNSPEREFWYTVKNVGVLPCSPDIRMA